MLEQIVGEITEAASERLLYGACSNPLFEVGLGVGDHAPVSEGLSAGPPQFVSALLFMDCVVLLLEIGKNKRGSLSPLIKPEVNA